MKGEKGKEKGERKKEKGKGGHRTPRRKKMDKKKNKNMNNSKKKHKKRARTCIYEKKIVILHVNLAYYAKERIYSGRRFDDPTRV